jgi:hypothetical protein
MRRPRLRAVDFGMQVGTRRIETTKHTLRTAEFRRPRAWWCRQSRTNGSPVQRLYNLSKVAERDKPGYRL